MGSPAGEGQGVGGGRVMGSSGGEDQAMVLVSDDGAVSVRDDGVIFVRLGKVELGQGVLTALAQIAADALGADLGQVRMLAASTVAGPDEGITAGSRSISHAGPPLRETCARVRAACAAEAARRWGVSPAEVTVRRGEFRCGDRTATYADLAPVADALTAGPPTDTLQAATLQAAALEAEAPPAEDPVFVGVSVPRLDLPDKIAGRPRFIHDLRLPGQLYGRVLRPPSPAARLTDLTPLPDLHVVRDGSFVGVLAETEAAADRALARLRKACAWDDHDSLPDEHDLDTFLRRGPHETITVRTPEDAPPEGEPRAATYSRPFIAHASIAPSCATARWNPDGTLDVWSHTQGVHPLRRALARILEAEVQVHHVEGAGCYGHNAADDVALDAALLAREADGRPVQVRWSRQDELTWAPFGSAMSVDVAAVVDEAGLVRSWRYDVWSQGHLSRPGYAEGTPGLLAGAHLERPWAYPAAVDPSPQGGSGTARNAVPIYDFPRMEITAHRVLETPIRSSALRSLGAFMNVFAIESFMDELALAAGMDPLAYRLAHLSDPRARMVLERAADAAGWGGGAELGLGFARYKGVGAYCAAVAEVEAEQDVRVRRLTIAVDVGQVVNPDGVRNQIEGGATQAASWTLKERVRFDRRAITSGDWESYPILRFSEAPEVAVELVEHPGTPSAGAGEAAQGPVAAAIANALAATLGVRIRDLPLDREAVLKAIQ